METLLRIQKYKRITDEIQLKNFDRVNYFVGKNSSGKTSILNALSHLNDGGNSRRFFSENSIVEFSINAKKQFILWDKNNPNRTTHKGDLQLIIMVPDEQYSEKGANGTTKMGKFNYLEMQKERLDYLNKTAEMIGIKPIVAKRIIDNDDPWDTSVGTRVFLQDERNILVEYVAEGLKAFNSIRFFMTECFRSLQPDQIKRTDAIFVIIDEPENNLYPDLQKRVPRFIDEFLKSLAPELSSKIYFCISTHSPFIVSAASDLQGQKIYLLSEGQLVDLKLNRVPSSEGFKGYECAEVSGQMLGADVTDLGYPENYVILEEYSMQLILLKAKELNLIENVQFVSASGATRIIKYSETINEIENFNTLLKCNPFYSKKYFIILDNASALGEAEKKRLYKIRDSIGDRFTELKKTSLEEYYKDFDSDIYSNFLNEIEGVSSREKGLIKAKYASLICEKLNTKIDFSKLFNGELDFLLK